MDEASNRTAGFSAGEKRVSAAQTAARTAAKKNLDLAIQTQEPRIAHTKCKIKFSIELQAKLQLIHGGH
jgi:hypothetical protein